MTHSLSFSTLKIGIVQSTFNAQISEGLLACCLAQLEKLGVPRLNIVHHKVPGALEIPLALQHLARSQEFAALIAIGVVIRGDTYHFEVVANQSSAGIMQVSLNEHIPIANAVLTTENEAQAQARIEKGAEAAQVVVDMLNLLKQV